MASDNKLFLLDAYALIYRSYYAFIRNPRINSKGLNTSAVYGFANTLLELLRKEEPTHIAVVFDAPAATNRELEYKEYKANREETPEDIKISIPYIKRLVEAMHIPTLMLEGYEADDIIGTLAKQAEKEGYITYMMTPDKDFGQLVTENILMYKPGRGGKGPEIWGPKEVCERFNVEHPEQVIDILGLWGDSVDNIPGIPGIGEKTAAKLIGKYGSVENLLENTDDLKGKQKENVINFAEQGLLSKKLATIILDVPVDFEPDKLIMEDPDEEKLMELFSELEFRSLAKRMFGKETEIQTTATTGPNGQMDLFGSNGSDNPGSDEEEDLEDFKTIEDVDHDYKMIEEADARKKLIKDLNSQDVVCFDTEASELDSHKAELVGMSFSYESGKAFYVPVPPDKSDAQEIVDEFKAFFENESITKVGQNLKYDMLVMKNYGVEVKGGIYDTMVAHYLLRPDQKHGMDFLSETYLNYKPVSIETLIGKKGKNQKSMRSLEQSEISDYACEDADVTLQLYQLFKKETEKEGYLKKLLNDIELPLISVLADMEYEGIKIDIPALKKFSEELQKEIGELHKEIIDLAGTDFNVDSPKQLGDILFNHMGLDEKAKKTKSGQYSTSEDVLKKYEDKHEIVPKILDYRQLKKLKSTYVDPLPELVSERTGRIHTHYMQTATATGRLSSNKPNLQNIPIRTERGREIRKAFIPRGDEFLILAADYSQIELRIIAALSGDDSMKKAFADGEDIHSSTAAKVFGVELDEVDREMRSKAKAVNFGIAYGQTAFGLSQQLGISRGEAKEIIDNYFDQFPNVKKFMDEAIEKAKEQEYVETIMGRRRYLRDINSRNAVVRGQAERNAINAPIQGSAADIIKIAMISIREELMKKKWKSKMLLQVHDELVFDAHKDELEELQKMVKEKMESAVKLDVPLVVEMDAAENWLAAH